MAQQAQNPTLDHPLIPTIMDGANDWRTLTTDLIKLFLQEDLCFSSGEIAYLMRVHRPDLVFSVLSVGEYVRDLFYCDQMGQYADGHGGKISPIQVPRTTQGVGRTFPGVEVFVYGPDSRAAFDHPFEVDIPKPGQAHQTQPTSKPQAVRGGGGVVITGRNAVKDLAAKVHTDRRLCVTRDAFEAFVHITGRPLRGGDLVHLRFDADRVYITLDPQAGSTAYNLATERGRILFASPTTPFNPGDIYIVTADKDALTVDLSAPVS